MYDTDADVPDFVPVQARTSWRLAWHKVYGEQLAAGEDDGLAQVRAFQAADAYAHDNPIKGAAMPELLTFVKHLDIFKVIDNADGTHSVIGVATSEAVDKDHEIADYKGTLTEMKAWSDDAAIKTKAAGQEISLGNIRVQHDAKTIGGKVTAIQPDDSRKTITIDTQPRPVIYDEYIKTGMVTGFSIAGNYKSRSCNECDTPIDGRGRFCGKCKKEVDVRFVPTFTEISYVDNPCNPDASFTHVKTSGAIEILKFHDLKKAAGTCNCTCPDCKGGKCANCSNPTCDGKNCKNCPMQSQKAASEAGVLKTVEKFLIEQGLLKEKKTKRVAGEDLGSECFAYVGDKEDTSTWKLPYKGFSTEEKNKSHVRNALARFNQTQGIPSGEKAKVKAKLVAAAKKHGIEVSEKTKAAVLHAIACVMATHDDKPVALNEAKKFTQALGEALDKFDSDATLAKGMYTVGQLAQMLEGFSWIIASTTYERDYEQDDSTVPDDLRDVLEDLIPIFVAMATEEANELLSNLQGKKNTKAANGGQGGNMSETNADLLKAAHETLAEFWKKAKSLYHKCAAAHGKLCKAHEARAEHHKALSEHHGAIAEAGAEKAVTDELAKLDGNTDFEKKMDLLIEKSGSHSKLHAKIAKAHMGLHKCAMKAKDHHADLEMCHKGLGDAEQAPGVGGSSKDETAAHPGGKDEKVAGAELLKGVEGALEKALAPIASSVTELGKRMEKVEKDVDAAMKQLDGGPIAAAKNRLSTDRNDDNGNKGGDGKSISRLSTKRDSASATKTVGVF